MLYVGMRWVTGWREDEYVFKYSSGIQSMNILYIGSSGVLSLTPFKRLLASEYDIVAAGVSDPLVFDSK